MKDNAERQRAGRHVPAVMLFVMAVVVLVGADLAAKTQAFARVAPAAISLSGDWTGRPVIPPHEPVIVIPKVLALHLTANTGAVFGIGKGGRWVFVVFSVVAAAVILTIFARSGARSWVLHLALAAVLAGALGNLYDRLRFGVVRDMVLLFPGVKLPFGWRWPGGAEGLYPWIFNVADVCLVVGLLVLMILMWREERTCRDAKP